MATPTAEELLKKAKSLNKAKKYQEVIDLLPDELLATYSNVGLYLEKADASDFLNKGDKTLAITERALAIDPDNKRALHRRGNGYYDLNKYELAIEHYKRLIGDDNEFTEKGYYGMGICYAQLNQSEKAIDFLNKSLELHPESADTYNWLGNAYLDQNQPENAIKYYNKSIDLNPHLIYPYNGLGITYTDLNQPEKALYNLNKAITLDPNYDDTYYNRARLYFEQRKYDLALSDYQKYIELTQSNPDYYTSLSKSRVTEIEKLLDNPGFKRITELVNLIKELLRFNDACVTHYTGMSVAKALILNESPLRLSEGAYLNDTSEGRELFRYLSIHLFPVKSNDTIAESFARKPFIGSFVAESKHDDLTLWRMYGKEAKEEAKGCAVTIQKDRLLENLRLKLKAPKEDAGKGLLIDKELSFYRVAYRSKDDPNQFFIPSAKSDEDKLNGYMIELAELVKKYRKDQDSAPNLQNLLERLNEITYLFKSAEYQYENEIRLVISGIGFEKHVDTTSTPPRVFIKLVPINPAITKITLGPKVDRSDEWASAFYYTLDKQEYYPSILISHLPFK